LLLARLKENFFEAFQFLFRPGQAGIVFVNVKLRHFCAGTFAGVFDFKLRGRDLVRTVAGKLNMKDEQHQFLALVGQPPARLTVEQAAWVLGCQPHDVPILISCRLLNPLGNPPQNAVKFFSTAEVTETLTAFWQDSDILAKMVSVLVSTAALSSPTHCVTTLWKWSQLSESVYYSVLAFHSVSPPNEEVANKNRTAFTRENMP
jgi:hypothetical protein